MSNIPSQDPAPTTQSTLRLGTFTGVFTPTVLTILGVIMYLRMGWVVGHAGLWRALGIVILANGITLATALSLSSLATNMRVGVGGAYYLISRSFGLELGGAIGIPLYLSQTLSVTLYAYGIAESLQFILPDSLRDNATFLGAVAAAVIFLIVGIAARSTNLALKLQRVIMVLIIASLGSLFAGIYFTSGTIELTSTMTAASADVSDSPVEFWQIFAVFFPAVTGILSGVSLSGDLKDPQRAIPIGVLAAVVVGFLIYLAVPVGLHLAASPEALQSNQMIWLEVAAVPALILPGLWGAILSSAFGSILAAPRTLQALAGDRLVPQMLGVTSSKTGEPLVGLFISGAVALAGIALGDLNTVAQWLTVFFLTTYGALNTVSAIESLAGDPSFRPKIRTPWWVALLGAAGCILGMFAINPLACLSAIVLELGIFWLLNRRAMQTTWGDVRDGVWLSMTRYALLRLKESTPDPRNWRPHILVFVPDLETRWDLVKLCTDIGQQRGIVAVMTLVVGDVENHLEYASMRIKNNELLEERGVRAFCEVASVPELKTGIMTVAQSNGFAGLGANTVALNWSGTSSEELAELLTLTRQLEGLEKCTLIYRGAPRDPAKSRIVVWWKGRQHNGDLMLLLAHLLSLASGWQRSRIVLKSAVPQAHLAKPLEDEFKAILKDVRIRARVEIIVQSPTQTSAELIQEHSRDAALVFLGLPTPVAGSEQTYATTISNLVEGLPTTLLVRNAGPFRGRLV